MARKHPRHPGHGGKRPAGKFAPVASPARLAPDAGLVKVALVFFLTYAVLQTAAWGLAYQGYLDPVIELTAHAAGTCSTATGVPSTVIGNEIFLATRVLRIDLDCTGISLMLVYASLVLAYPLSIRSRLVGLAAGLPLLALANLLRLIAVAQLAPLGDKTFYFVHDYLFKVLMVAIVIVIWGVYLAWARRHAQRG